MITALRVHNLAVVESVEVSFDGGFNVITGETGAGKSLLVDALHLILGGRANTDMIRTGTDEASVEAIFDGVPLDGGALEEMGISPEEDGTLLIRRTVNRQGKGRVWINGALSTVGQLEKVARCLVDISGQHEHVSLLKPELHLGLLDAFAADGQEREAYRKAYDALADRRRARESLMTDDASREQRVDYLKFQLDEIDAVDPKPGELEELEQRRRSLESVERQKGALAQVDQLLYSGDGCVADLLAEAENALKSIVQVSPEAGQWLESVNAARIDLSEAAREISRRMDGLAEDPEELERTMEREEAIRRLARKHGGTVEAILEKRDAMRAEVDGFQRQDEILAALDSEISLLAKDALAKGKALSTARQKAAADFGRAVETELKKLAMDRTVFQVSLTAHRSGAGALDEGGSVLSASGLETAEFLIAPNSGEAIKPLARIASGGELSRVMLAIKRVLASADPVFTYVFDEVDTGLSGAAADAVGRLLHDVSRERQILVVTHLPQVAAFGTTHFTVSKEDVEGRTRTRITLLDQDGREKELARMLAGSSITAAAVINARALMDSCRSYGAAANPRRGKDAPASAKSATGSNEPPAGQCDLFGRRG